MAAMFNQRPRGLFGNMVQQAGQTPGYGDGVREQMAQAPVGMAAPQEQAPAPKRPGFNDPGGWAERIGVIGGIMRDDDNGQAIQQYQQLQAFRAREAQAIQQAQQDRENQWTDWVKRETYKRNNPEPSQAQPYRTEDNAGNVHELGADGKFRPIFIDPTDKTYMQDGQMITVPNVVRQQQGGAATGPAIGTERNGYRFKGGNPNDQNSWESVAQGGPTPPASGGFRR